MAWRKKKSIGMDSMHLGRATYVDWPVALLHVVGSEQGARARELVKKAVFETEHRGRSHNGGLRVDGTDNLLTPRLWNCFSI